MKRNNKIYWKREITFLCFIIPALVLYILFFILPVGMGVGYSLTDWSGLSGNVTFLGLANYQRLFGDRAFIQAFRFTGLYTILVVVFTIGLGLILALCLNAHIKGRGFFRSALFFPAVLSMLTVGMVFNEILTRAIPALGDLTGIEALQINVLSRVTTAPFGVLFVHIWQGLAIPTILLLAGLQAVPHDLYEAAELDGASKWAQFKAITIPFLLPVLSVVLILTLKSGLMVFDYILIMTEGGPAGSTTSLTMNIYNLGFRQLQFGYAIAQAMVITMIVFIISFAQIKFTNKRKVY